MGILPCHSRGLYMDATMKANFTPPSLLRTWQGRSLHLSWRIFSITASQRPPGSELMLLLQKCIWLLAAIAREVNSPCAFLSTWQGTLLCVGLSHVIYANAVISFSRCFFIVLLQNWQDSSRDFCFFLPVFQGMEYIASSSCSHK